MKRVMMKRSFKQFVEQELGGVAHFVIYGILEWTLMILLFINGFIALFTNEFANFFELKAPCFQCTQSVFMNASDICICQKHQREVSSLGFCDAHKKLCSMKKMCERCLLSLATEKDQSNSSCETYKSLLHKDMEMLYGTSIDEQGVFGDEQQMTCKSSSEHLCSCCGAPLKANSNILSAAGRRKGGGGFVSSASPVVSPKYSKNYGEKMMRSGGNCNMFFGIPLTDSAGNSPRWSSSLKSCLDGKSSSSLMELYMELDEERSASAVAANNAMAMITRLHSEKAALQMEALQYQRMVEEQAEYDEEAFQEMNDYISRRDEEIRDLEAELDAYRAKYGTLQEDDAAME